MELKRIGNDFTVTLNITRKGSPEDFTNTSGITVVLQHMTCSFIRLIPNQITVNGGKVSFPVTADQQKEPSKYRVLVKYHKTALDGLKTYTVDKCEIFELVSDSCTDTSDTDVVADIDVQIEQDGKDGLSAYELAVFNGYNGMREEYERALTDAPKLATQVSKLKRRSKSIRDSIIVVESLDRRVPYNANKGQLRTNLQIIQVEISLFCIIPVSKV